MKKYLLVLIMIASPIIAKDHVLGQSYVELGFNIGDTIFVNDVKFNNVNIGGTAIFGIEWDFISHIFSLELFQFTMSFLVSSGYQPAIPIGFDGNMRFFNMAFGDTKSNYNYFIYILGIGMDVQFFEDKEHDIVGLAGGVEMLLPLGFKR